MPANPDPVTANVRAEMARRKMNQTDVAAILGLSQVSVSARLRGTTEWRVSELRALAQHFGVSVSTLVDDQQAGAA